MGIRKMENTANFQYRFQIGGKTYQGPTNTSNKADALKIEKEAKEAVKAANFLAKAAAASTAATSPFCTVPRPSPAALALHSAAADDRLSLARAIGKYVRHRESEMAFKGIDPKASNWPHELKCFKWIVSHFGLDFAIDDLRTDHVRQLVAARKALPKVQRTLKDGSLSKTLQSARSGGDVNRYSWQLLRRVHVHVSKVLEIPLRQIDWAAKGIKQEETELVDREFTPSYEEKFRNAVVSVRKSKKAICPASTRVKAPSVAKSRWKDGYSDMVAFGLMSGLRISNLVIKWSQVRLDVREIKNVQKGRRKFTTKITDDMLDLLKRQIGNDPTYVFTHVADRTTTNHKAKKKFVKGQRYPVTKVGFEQWFRRTAKSAGVEVTPHDMRRAALRDLWRVTGDRSAVRALSGHSTDAMLDRYLGPITPDNEMEKLNAAAKARRARAVASKNLFSAGDASSEELAACA